MKDVKSLAASTITSSISKSIAEFAADVNNAATNSVPAGMVDGWNSGLGASIFDHTNLTAAKGASIFDHANLTTTKGASIIENANLTTAKAEDITIHANLTSNREQAHLRQMVTDDAFTKLMDIVTFNASNVTISTNTTITDKNIYRSLTVNAGVILTVNTTSELVSGVIIAYSITNNGTITRTAQGGTGNTHPGGTAIIYRIGTNTLGLGGNGGTGGDIAGTGGGREGVSGGGSVTYTTKTGAEIGDICFNAVVDYLIRTVQSKSSPTAVQEFIDVYGAGGGKPPFCSGGTGGGGLLIICKTITNTSLISANGNNGDSCNGAGGAGSGGQIIIIANDYDNTGGTIQSNGGIGGTGGAFTGGGGGGGGGAIYVLYKTQTAAGTLTAAGGAGGTGAGGNGTAGATGTALAIAI